MPSLNFDINIIKLIGFIICNIGLFFILTSVIGLNKFEGFFAKIHAASLSDSFGIPIFLVGLALFSYSHLSIKIIFLIIFIYIIGPLSSHALAKASWLHNKQKESSHE